MGKSYIIYFKLLFSLLRKHRTYNITCLIILGQIVILVCRHNDFPLAIREIFNNDLEGWNFDSDLSQHPKFKDYPMDHTDLQRMKKGRVGGQVTLIFETILFC